MHPLFAIQAHCINRCFEAVCLALLTGFAGHAQDVAAQTSRLWGAAGEEWRADGRLPDYSFAGYQRGEQPLPDRPADLSVKDFGATGDGRTDDTAAFRQALEQAAGKVIAVPPGRYRITDMLEIRHPGTVLKGSGPERSVIYVPRPLEEIRSNMGATTDGRPTSNYSWSGGILSIKGRWDNTRLSQVTASSFTTSPSPGARRATSYIKAAVKT